MSKLLINSITDVGKKIDPKAITSGLTDLTKKIDFSDIAKKIDVSDIAKKIDVSDVAKKIDVSDIAKKVDVSDIAKKVDVSDVAKKVDVGDVAKKVDVSDVAKKVDVSDVAEKTNKLKNITKKGALGAAVLGGGIGLTAAAVIKSKESFDKRNNKFFDIVRIYNEGEGVFSFFSKSTTDANVFIEFKNEEKLKMYPEEEVVITETDININGQYEIVKVISETVILVKLLSPSKTEVKLLSALKTEGKTGKLKLLADEKNDAMNVIKEGVETVVEPATSVVRTLGGGIVDMILDMIPENIKQGITYFLVVIVSLFVIWLISWLYSIVKPFIS